MKLGLPAIGLALALAACATPAGVTGAPSVGGIPNTPLNLGDWRRATASATSEAFSREVAARYRAGLTLAAVSGDLRRNDFTCANNRDTGGRGDPPDQICRKTVSIESCTHTWQVHLFAVDGGAELARTRALYDRRCGGDGLLGGPG